MRKSCLPCLRLSFIHSLQMYVCTSPFFFLFDGNYKSGAECVNIDMWICRDVVHFRLFSIHLWKPFIHWLTILLITFCKLVISILCLNYFYSMQETISNIFDHFWFTYFTLLITTNVKSISWSNLFHLMMKLSHQM